MPARVAFIINEYFNEHNLQEEYNFSFPSQRAWGTSPFLMEAYPTHLASNYEKTMYFKRYIIDGGWLLNNDTFLDTAYWVIRKWGGISSFKENEENTTALQNLQDTLIADNPNIHAIPFKKISSISKVASLLKPDLCAIYDSRAIYSLNWLLFIHAPGLPLFCQPEGRNEDMANLHQTTIFNLSHAGAIFLDKTRCYARYCEFLQRIAHELHLLGRQNVSITDIEMLLFTIASTHIVADIHNRVTIAIDRPNS
jgi:hypothetical protein